MPRMTKKFEQENSMFIKQNAQRKRICYTEICRNCQSDCKQAWCVELVHCKNYSPKAAPPPHFGISEKVPI